MEKIMIHGAFADRIDAIIGYKPDYVSECFLTKEIELDDNSTKEEFIEMFIEAISFKIENEFVVFTIKKPESEILKWKEDELIYYKSNIRRLRYWCNLKEEYRIEIETYLIHKGLQWILDEIKS